MKKLLSCCAVLALLSLPSLARETLYGSAASEYKVKATVDSFTGKAPSEPFVVNADDDTVSVTFQIAKMETGKKKRDKEMLHMFHADEFPLIVGSAPVSNILALSPSAEPVDLALDMVIHGITNRVDAKVSNVTTADGITTFEMDFPLTLSAFDLKAPSIMMMIKVADVVNVTTRVTVSNKAP